MATAWEILIANSRLDSGTAWEHLNAQQGGGGYESIVLTDGLEVEMADCTFDAALELDPISVDIDPADLEVEIEEDQFEIEVCDGD